MAEDKTENSKAREQFIRSIKSSNVFKTTYSNASLFKAMLENRFNKSTLDDLSDYQLEELDKYLKKLDAMQIGKVEMATKNQISHIRNLWKPIGSETTLMSHAKTLLGKEVKTLESLSKKEAQRVIDNIKKLNPRES